MSGIAKCRVKGCPGRVEISTDGRGGTVERCQCCEKRETWRIQHVPDVARKACDICAGLFTVDRRAIKTRYCPACRPLVKKKESREASLRFQKKTRTA